MNKLSTHLQFFSRILCPAVISLLIASGSSTAIAASNPDSCALLKPADLTALLGGTPIATNIRGNCNWAASGSTKKLIALKYKHTGSAAEMAFAGARKNSSKGGKVTDETGLGDKAFSTTSSFGVTMMVIKQGRLIQLMLMTGQAGTAKDLDALRPVAKKAIAAF